NPAGKVGAGDPAAVFDRNGNLYFVHLLSSGLDIGVAKSTDGGQTWGGAVDVAAGNCDKEWVGVGPDPSNLNNDIVYIIYRKDVSTDVQIHSVRSINGGTTWVNDQIINDDSIAGDDRATFGTPIVRTSNGRVYAI